METVFEFLLTSSGFRGPFDFLQLAGGANNQIFCVKAPNGASLLLKRYFHHPSDLRDRAQSEFAFSTFAWENGVSVLPRPYGCDRKNQLGIYEFISGRSLLPEEITENAVEAALEFTQKVNHHKNQPSAKRLPNASEACFSFLQHLRCVERRLDALQMIEQRSRIDQETAAFLNGPLKQVWTQTRDKALMSAQQAGLSIDKDLEWEDRCISPSDFGFHNAFITANNNYRFFDFEYAGWDDPAKLVCDFFCQPALPIPLEYFEWVASQITSKLSDPNLHLHRIHLLFPVYQIKWCCILLNDFLQLGRDRRRFACGTEEEDTRKSNQLKKARKALEQVVGS